MVQWMVEILQVANTLSRELEKSVYLGWLIFAYHNCFWAEADWPFPKRPWWITVSAQVVSCCVYKIAIIVGLELARKLSEFFLLLGWSCCSSPPANKQLHGSPAFWQYLAKCSWNRFLGGHLSIWNTLAYLFSILVVDHWSVCLFLIDYIYFPFEHFNFLLLSISALCLKFENWEMTISIIFFDRQNV